MIIGINASFLRKPETGIGQVTTQFLRTLDKIVAQEGKNKKDIFHIYTQEPHEEIWSSRSMCDRTFLPPYKRDDLIRKIWWEKHLLPQMAYNNRCEVFLSLYQSTTITRLPMRHIMVVHDLVPRHYPIYRNNLRKKMDWHLTENAIVMADRLFAVSTQTEKDVINNLVRDAKTISTNHIDCDPIFKNVVTATQSRRVLDHYNLNAGYILSGGGMDVRKNIDGVLVTYKNMREKMRAKKASIPKLVIYGKLQPHLAPVATDAQKIAQQLNIGPYVTFLDVVPQKDLPAIFHNALCFFYPSKYEGFGLPLLEAMNSGIPVITSRNPALKEVGGDAPLYCNPEDVDDMVTALGSVLNNPQLRHTMKERGKERTKIFSYETFTQKILATINE
ncbi:MAG: glycosyltransferase family 4 protein [Candidatus Moranbacteria bacterium]|nr:glycosyltransferase family 4 protein [Candidatus Moranbacteria bacterium]